MSSPTYALTTLRKESLVVPFQFFPKRVPKLFKSQVGATFYEVNEHSDLCFDNTQKKQSGCSFPIFFKKGSKTFRNTSRSNFFRSKWTLWLMLWQQWVIRKNSLIVLFQFFRKGVLKLFKTQVGVTFYDVDDHSDSR